VATALRQEIWDPLVRHLANVTRVFIVPDGPLHLVSFAALPQGSSSYIVETGPVLHYLSAEKDLVTTNTALVTGGLLAMGGPAFDESNPASTPSIGSFRGMRSACSDFQSMRFDPLPATLKEVNEVVSLWNGSRAMQTETNTSDGSRSDAVELTGAAASESAFKAQAAGRRVLHLATHGFFLRDRCSAPVDAVRALTPPEPSMKTAKQNPLVLSGLILAGANRRNTAPPDQEDGVLTAEEVAALNLTSVEWAVLSGCDTGVGEVNAGEGVLGLRRAFQLAGVRTVIMSLWSVEDQATRDWMRALYEGRLRKTLSTVDAVREASLHLIHQRRTKHLSTHPFYWGGFVAAGAWR
jgi:CHAT domain-containing protein